MSSLRQSTLIRRHLFHTKTARFSLRNVSTNSTINAKPVTTRYVMAGATLLGVGAAVWTGWQYTAPIFSDERHLKTRKIAMNNISESHSGVETADKRLKPLTAVEAEDELRRHSQTHTVSHPGMPVFRYDSNSVGSNFPNEDDYASAIVTFPTNGATPDAPLALFAVFDGHSGWQTSRHLGRTLIPELLKQLPSVLSSSTLLPDPSENDGTKSNALKHTASDEAVQTVIKNVFTEMDDKIVKAPLQHLEEYEALGSPERPHRRLPLEIHVRNLQALGLATSGSCAILACLDPISNRIHVANTGDSRAVMGTWEASSEAVPNGKGVWRTSVFSEDHTGFNPAEITRMQSEHPEDEADKVCLNGRALGGLGITRAFGDARFKWSAEDIEKVYQMVSSSRKPYPHYHTPPYVTALPQVISAPLTAPTPGATQPQRHFLVLATDGVFDCLTNDEVVGLVGGWLDGRRGAHPRAEILSGVASADPSDPPYQAQRGWDFNGGADFIFKDDNIATHVIRNALGGVDNDKLKAILSLPVPYSRRHRDDMTVFVILWERGATSSGDTTPEGSKPL